MPKSLTAHLVRSDLYSFQGYASAHKTGLAGEIWLHANESAFANPIDQQGTLRRYPEPQPPSLVKAFANLYGCHVDQLLIGRGSDECIDLLVRCICMPNADAIVITPPVFGMYAVAARLQMARVVEVPLRDEGNEFVIDPQAIVNASQLHRAKLVFLCSPSNPTGGTIASETIRSIALQLAEQAVVVIDEAYIEFSSQPSAVALIAALPNVVVLRTLSKAHGLAGVRIGCCIGQPELISIMRSCQAPYPIPTPARLIVEKAMDREVLRQTHSQVQQIVQERTRLSEALSQLAGVRQVYSSEGNFILVRFHQVAHAFATLLDHGIVVRDQRTAPQLGDALRISIGTPAQQTATIAALQTLQAPS